MTRYKKKPKPLSNDITIVYDTREQKPWLFLSKRWPMKRKHLKVGDYSVEGFEDKIAIEKKSGINELLSNLTGKERPRFERFLKRMSKYPIKAIIVEEPFTYSAVSTRVYILRKKSNSRLTEFTVFFWVSKIITKYNIPVIFIDKRSSEVFVPSLIERAIEKAKEL